MIELIVRYIFLFIILLGLMEFCYIKLKVKSEFIPIVLFSSIGMIIFFAGLLNIMLEAFIFLVLFSLLYLIYLLIKRKFTFELITPGILFFLIFSMYLAFILKGVKFVAYDDFSHWGLVARDIINNNKFPNFESVIVFQAYPTGSASFIYFVSKMLGNTEGVMLFSQSLLVLSGIIPLFAFINKNKILSYTIVFLATIFFLTSNVGFLALSVDTLLSILCLASSAIIIYGYNNKEFKWLYLEILPILSLLMIVKNSGILFVLINVVLLFYYSIKYENNKFKTIQKVLVTLIVPYICKFLWGKHVQLVFSKGFESKHAMSAENYKNIFKEKSTTDIQLIVKKFISRSTDISQIEIQIFILCLAIFLFSFLFIKAKKIKIENNPSLGLKFFFSSIILYYIYQLGLLSTYIFSMPLGEAINLASYERYNLTMVMYMYGIVIIYLLSLINEVKIKNKHSKVINIVLCTFVVILPLYLKYPTVTDLIKKEEYVQKDRNILATIYNENNLVQNEQYIIYLSNHPEINWASYFHYVSIYTLHSDNIKIITDEKINDIDLINEKTNLIILRDDDLINKKLKSMGIENYHQIIKID